MKNVEMAMTPPARKAMRVRGGEAAVAQDAQRDERVGRGRLAGDEGERTPRPAMATDHATLLAPQPWSEATVKP